MKDKLLQAEGKELSRLLGEVLQPEKKHAFNMCDRCIDCNKSRKYARTFCETPIQLHWSTAMRWRDWAVEEYGEDVYWAALCEVFKSSQNPTSSSMPKYQWFVFAICRFKPHHYLQAAALCKLNKEGKEQ